MQQRHRPPKTFHRSHITAQVERREPCCIVSQRVRPKPLQQLHHALVAARCGKVHRRIAADRRAVGIRPKISHEAFAKPRQTHRRGAMQQCAALVVLVRDVNAARHEGPSDGADVASLQVRKHPLHGPLLFPLGGFRHPSAPLALPC